MKKILFILSLYPLLGISQSWQQKVNYEINVDLDVKTNKMKGTEKLIYFNESPDTLNKVYFHLYFNAFQPGSMMDVRSRVLPDPDGRVRDRIVKLKPDEIGYHQIEDLKFNGTSVPFTVEGTILIIQLAKPIMPKTSAEFFLQFQSQVPLQIRRSGRDSREGIEFSMSQWYPKIAEYDENGWHPIPYIAREFYAPWGNFDVKITLDPSYVIGATGILQNPDQIGHGYTKNTIKTGKSPLTWHFKAENVHDFVWAADPDYVHDIMQVPNGPQIHFFYQNDSLAYIWKKAQPYITRSFQFMNENFGQYPYSTFSVIQGGDGGMEYPMATLITGSRDLEGLIDVSIHEILHSWYAMLLATHESYFAWMDEGFTSFAENLTRQFIMDGSDGLDPGIFMNGEYRSYFALVRDGKEEALSTHADHFSTNRAYGVGSYSKGAIALHQLGYIIGNESLMKGLRRYYYTWRFKHPDKNDFLRIMERQSQIELDWYFDYWINTTHTIDYGIKSVTSKSNQTQIVLERIGKMPMPIELWITYTDGTKEIAYIPLQQMYGTKTPETSMKTTPFSSWPWVNPYYMLQINKPSEQIQSIAIDPSGRMADINSENNYYPMKSDITAGDKK